MSGEVTLKKIIVLIIIFLIGTPAAIRDIQDAQVEAIDAVSYTHLVEIPREHLRIVKIKAQQKMPAVIQIGGKYFIMQNFIRHIYEYFPVLIEEAAVHIIMKASEHTAIPHVMPVNDRIRICKILSLIHI